MIGKLTEFMGLAELLMGIFTANANSTKVLFFPLWFLGA